ncbi:molybdenum cofactor synthesis domain protein [Thermaerobacter marianensis DSM 12885]|uniref:Molybdopterin molybdenumtransferase n=1 Tax=Thermaerobacter marianensis (strain ATCC 700841 / DSM 12885 / JCM 10246 / 7p75a) TaxID=644966 RepID=E6SME0_THEM7|nr:gephyrin-like molybdotransferase Glp [Thermaerobacter marianensis]ADU50400.1 molybdenum cofactor synthesis domain protein [Thermaerobacter marianensis DSM 12885]
MPDRSILHDERGPHEPPGPGTPGFRAPFPTAGLPTVAEARQRILAAAGRPPLQVEELPLAEALGRVLAKPVYAPEDVPGFHRSTVDGYAVRSQDLRGIQPDRPARLQVVGRVLVGRPADVRVEAGQAVAVPTGGMLPPGADCVVMFEHTSREGPWLLVHRFAGPGDNVIARGEDAVAGLALLAPGRRLGPADLGALAGAGITRVAVAREPRVALLLTGDEVVPPGRSPGPGQIRDINGVALAAALRQDGARPLEPVYVPDEPAAFRQALRDALAAADLVLISGGSSVGERDLTAELAAELESPGVILHGVALKPGKPTLFAMAGRTPVFGLPGNPVSALVVYRLLVRPVIFRWLGLEESPGPGPRIRARLETPLRRPPGREEYVPVALIWRGGEYGARPQPRKSGLITALTGAQGLVHLPLEVEGLPAGAEVEVIPW